MLSEEIEDQDKDLEEQLVVKVCETYATTVNREVKTGDVKPSGSVDDILQEIFDSKYDHESRSEFLLEFLVFISAVENRHELSYSMNQIFHQFVMLEDRVEGLNSSTYAHIDILNKFEEVQDGALAHCLKIQSTICLDYYLAHCQDLLIHPAIKDQLLYHLILQAQYESYGNDILQKLLNNNI